ncbi:MAG TPA: hexose kinase [Streptosporangiaceae bacterium]
MCGFLAEVTVSGRILVVALNPALDVTHDVERVDWAGVNRASRVLVRPGGKGLNVGRVLHALGVDVLVMGVLGGRTGEAVGDALAEVGVTAEFLAIGGETRRTFVVVDGGRGQAALFNEPGPVVSPEEYAAFRDRFVAEAGRSAAVVLTGSLPVGIPGDCYAELSELAVRAGVNVVLDADGEALRCGVAGHPTVVKPNAAELESVAGRPVGRGDVAAIVAAAEELRRAGAEAVVVSLGADGLLAVTDEGVWRAVPPGRVGVNATGAGDAVVAGLVWRMVAGDTWPERLRHAVALGSAAAAAPAAGEFSHGEYERVLAEVRVGRVGAR